jgi:hypothetical protein
MAVGPMSTYAVHRLLKRLRNDAEFRERLNRDSDAALAEFDLSTDERHALQSGEVGRLHAMGVHGYLLNTLARHRVFGITPELYVERIRQT